MAAKDPVARRRFDELIEEAQVAIEPVTEAQARIARQAYRDFGKTSGHPAKLNFGDCFSYALAKTIRGAAFVQGTRLLADRCEVGAGVSSALDEIGEQWGTSRLSPGLSTVYVPSVPQVLPFPSRFGIELQLLIK